MSIHAGADPHPDPTAAFPPARKPNRSYSRFKHCEAGCRASRGGRLQRERARLRPRRGYPEPGAWLHTPPERPGVGFGFLILVVRRLGRVCGGRLSKGGAATFLSVPEGWLHIPSGPAALVDVCVAVQAPSCSRNRGTQTKGKRVSPFWSERSRLTGSLHLSADVAQPLGALHDGRRVAHAVRRQIRPMTTGFTYLLSSHGRGLCDEPQLPGLLFVIARGGHEPAELNLDQLERGTGVV